jgi:ClpP class serine protease
MDRTEATKAAGLRIEVIRSGTRKAEGHPDIPLSDSVISHFQSRIDGLAKQFFRLVKEARPIKIREIEALQGKCVYGQKAVNAGLADGVASFDEVLASMSEDDGLGEGNGLRGAQESVTVGEVMSYAVLQKKVASALAALTAAKNPASRKRCASAYAAAVSALTEAKVKKTYEKKTTETETEEDDGEAEKSELEDEESASDDNGDDDDDDGDDDGSDAKQKAAKKASARADKKVGSLESFVRSITGQSNSASAQQVLASMHEQALQNEANTQEIARLKADAARTRLNAMVSEGVAAGKIKPAQLAWAKTQTVASLKSYLEATPAMFQPRAKETLESPSGSADTGAVGPDGVTDFERALCAEQGVKVEAYVKQRDGKSAAAPKVN